MTSLTTKALLTGGALFLTLALPSAHGQTTRDTPPVGTAAPAETSPNTPTAETPAPAESAPTPPAEETPKPKRRFRIGPEVGVFLPTSSKTRDQFGSAWLSFGVGLGSIDRVTPHGQISLDLQLLYQTRDGNHAFIAPLGVSYRKAVSQSGQNTVYVGATGDLYLADLRSSDYNVHSGLRTGFGGSALTGINFGESGFLEARYLLVSRIKGFDLSGLNLTAGYRF